MKKYIILLISLFIGLASLWAVWEGNGIASSLSEFQEDGMFVKSALFPKYTLIEILNLEQDTKVRAIVLEGEEKEGILMSFSPSVADALKVKIGDVVRIRVESPSLVQEDREKAIEDIASAPIEEVQAEKKEDILLDKKDEVPPKKIDVEEVEKKESAPIHDENEVLLYDFKPISKRTEKTKKENDGISFEPAFIEDDVSLNLNIPNFQKEEEAPSKKEDERIIAPIKTVQKEAKKASTPLSATSPKTVTIPEKRPTYLEEVSMRPPKEVAIPKAKPVENEQKKDEKQIAVAPVLSIREIKEKRSEKDAEKIEPVKDVILIEKKVEEKQIPSPIVQEISSIKKDEHDDVVEYKEVPTIDKIEEKTVTTDEPKMEEKEVMNVPSIVEPSKEEGEREDIKVAEINEIKKEEVVVEDENIIEPVKEIASPENTQNLQDNVNIAEVPIVQAVKEAPPEVEENKVVEEEKTEEKEEEIVEDTEDVDETGEEGNTDKVIIKEPVFELPQGEIAILDEMDEGEIKEEIAQVVEKEEAKEEEVAEEKVEEKQIDKREMNKAFDERPLREINVKTRNVSRLDEVPSREAEYLPRRANMVAIENDEITKKEDESNVREMPLNEINVSNKPQEKFLEKVEEKKEETIKEEIATSEEKVEKEDNKEAEKIEEKALEKTKDEKLEEPVKKTEEIKEEIKETVEAEPKNEEFLQPELLKDREKDVDNREEKIQKQEPKIEEEKPKKMESLPNEKVAEDEEGYLPLGRAIKGYSYVQIAVFASLLSAKDVLIKYSGQYPIIVEKRDDKKYAVLVGPLQKDEVGAIKERFRAFGFSDAYSR